MLFWIFNLQGTLATIKLNMSKKKSTGTKTAAGSRSMKRNLDTGVEACDNRVKKNKHHTTNEKPNMLDIFNNKNKIDMQKVFILKTRNWKTNDETCLAKCLVKQSLS